MLGVAYWQLYAGTKPPFPNATTPRALSEEMNALLARDPDAAAPLGHVEGMPRFMRDLVVKMCALNMEKRPTTSDVCDILARHIKADIHRLSLPPRGVDVVPQSRRKSDVASEQAKARRRRVSTSQWPKVARQSQGSQVQANPRKTDAPAVPSAPVVTLVRTPISQSSEQVRQRLLLCIEQLQSEEIELLVSSLELRTCFFVSQSGASE